MGRAAPGFNLFFFPVATVSSRSFPPTTGIGKRHFAVKDTFAGTPTVTAAGHCYAALQLKMAGKLTISDSHGMATAMISSTALSQFRDAQ